MRVITRLGPATILFAWLFILTADQGTAQVALKEPGGSPSDVQLALFNPDEHAWRLFLYLNHQAWRGKAGEADPAKQSITD